MADLHSEPRGNSSMATWILIPVILLAILYFLAKGCTDVVPGEDSIQEHHAPATTAPHTQ